MDTTLYVLSVIILVPIAAAGGVYCAGWILAILEAILHK